MFVETPWSPIHLWKCDISTHQNHRSMTMRVLATSNDADLIKSDMVDLIKSMSFEVVSTHIIVYQRLCHIKKLI